MLLTEEEVKQRLESPENLINRLRSLSSSKGVLPFVPVHKSDGHKRENIRIQSLPPSIDDLMDDVEDKLAANQAGELAQSILTDALQTLKVRLPEIHKAKDLATVAKDMSHIATNLEAKNQNIKNINQTQVVIYAPQIMKEEEFDVIDIFDEPKSCPQLT